MSLFKTRTGSVPFCFFALALLSVADAAELRNAHVTQIINDVRLLRAKAAARPAVVNDSVNVGTAVRTGTDSRTELTFSDLTITRLGANTIFSFNGEARQIELDSGAILVQVPRNGAEVKVRAAAVTAAISGGTGLFECNKGFPTKLLMLEGIGRFYPTGHPELAVIVHGGEMVMMTPDGRITGPTKFNAALVYQTSKLITSFPPLSNADLILAVIDGQQAELMSQSPASAVPPSSRDAIDVISTSVTASGASSPPSAPPSKFGPPSTITSPDPYVINRTTHIQTDPTITTNGITHFGKLYRGTALDGTPPEFLFGQAPTAFDQMVFNGPQNNLPIAVFKFADLQLTGNPSVTVPSGSTTNLALVSVGTITSGAPGGTLTFAGITRLSFITQNDSITLGPEISFSSLDHLEFYARGTGSGLTLASPISNVNVVKLNAEGSIQVNGDETAGEFDALAGANFLTGSGVITAGTVNIQSLGDINIDGSKFPNPPGGGGSFVLNAANTLNVAIVGGGGQPFGWDTLTATATTINLTSSTPATFNFSNSSGVKFTAGTGGINAPNINFVGSNLTMTSGGGINIDSFVSPPNGQGGNIPGGTINAAGAVNATGNITNTTDLTAGTSIMVGGTLASNNITAGTTIDLGGQLFAVNVTAGGNITANGVGVITINAPTSILTAGSQGIFAEKTQNGAAEQNTFNISSIISPNGMDFSGNQFNGTNGLSSGGLLTINANTLTFDSATGIAFANFNGADAGAFGGSSPAEGGNGGVFNVNTTGNITANHGADIMATTGLNTAAGVHSGAGGSVTLRSTGGMVTVNDTVQVSSNDGPARRQSASGGTIAMRSDVATGVAINIGSSAQLLSLLDAVAPGPGGLITILATGTNSSINASGQIEADKGEVDIRQTGVAGQTTLNNATVHGDVVKISALGTNGVLNIGSGNVLGADTILKLYAIGSNGTLNFLSNVTLSSPANILAANTINIAQGVIVTINSAQAADVFTNNPNYFGFGGTGNRFTGTFGGAGANKPQPLVNAPPLGGPGHGP